jgi:hypothetical protein
MANHLGGAKPGRGTTVGKGLRGFRQSGEFKESKGTGVAGAGLRDREQRERGRKAAADLREKNLRRELAGEGESDVSKYDDQLAAAIRAVDFRNSPIGRSLLADDFLSGDLTAREFQELQGLRTDPRQSLESRRQLNIALGLNPTTGMGIIDSLRSGFQGEQFQQDRRRLGQLLSLSPIRQGIVNLLGGEIDLPQTTAEQFGITAEEDARLRVLSNPEIVSRLLPDVEDTAADVPSVPTVEDVSPEQIIAPRTLDDIALDTLSMRSMVNLPAINARINAALQPRNIAELRRLNFNPRLNLGMFNLNPNTGGLTNISSTPRAGTMTAGSMFQNPAMLNQRLSSFGQVGQPSGIGMSSTANTRAVAPFQTAKMPGFLRANPIRNLLGIVGTGLMMKRTPMEEQISEFTGDPIPDYQQTGIDSVFTGLN